MRILFIFVCSLLTIIPAFAEWEQVNYYPTAVDLVDISIYSKNNTNYAVAGGELGTIQYTTNGGASWSVTLLPTKENVISVVCVNDSIAMALTEKGKIFKTDNFCKSFLLLSFDAGVKLNKLRNLNDGSCYLIGDNGTIFRSVDNGSSWINQNTNTIENLNDIIYLDKDTYYIIGNHGTLIMTTDAGSNWKSISTGFNNNFLMIRTIGKNFISMMADSLNVLTSTDAGTTWNKNYVISNYSMYYKRPQVVSFYWINDKICNIKVLDVYSDTPMFYEYISTEGGDYWQSKKLDVISANPPYFGLKLNKIEFSGPDFGIGVGGHGEIALINIGSDNFLEYTNIAQNYSFNFCDIGAADENKFAVIGLYPNDGIYLSSNAGISWEKKALNIKSIDSGNIQLEDICYQSDNNILITSNSYKEYRIGSYTWTFIPRGNLDRSTDLGNSWNKYQNQITRGFSGIFMIDKNNGYIEEDGDSMKYTTNGGTSWVDIIFGDTATVNISISSTEPGTYYILRGFDTLQNKRFLCRTYEYGKTWEKLNEDHILSYCYKIKFINKLVGFAIGSKDTNINSSLERIFYIAKTIDGGLNWEYSYKCSPSNLDRQHIYDIEFADKNNGIAVGSFGMIVRTTDCGKSWIEDKTDFMTYNDNIISIAYPASNIAIALTDLGKMIKYLVVTDVKDSEPNDLLNFMIFPNPASDYIEIEGKEQDVPVTEVIHIYNIFGEMVNLTPALSKGDGVRIDISSLPTGLYFVRVRDKVSKFVKI